MAAGWKKAFVPEAAVLHAHDYPFRLFMRRYFDEYRGLRETTGHVEPIGLRRTARTVGAQLRDDLRYMRTSGVGRAGRVGWGARSARHHAGRAVFSALGSRAERLPPRLRERLSLEGRAGTAAGGADGLRTVTAAPRNVHEDILRYYRGERAPLAPPSPHDAEKPLLHFAWVVPPFRRGSGGHMTIFTLVRELEARGHSCSIWIHDPIGVMDRRAALAHHDVNEHFVRVRAGVFRGFDDWHGADVAFATGWQTAFPLSGLPDCALKAYYVQDYEPEFYPASAERLWADETYRMGYPCLASSPWLRELLRERYGADAEVFEYGVDLDVYRPLESERRAQSVLFYARPATPRRATELGMLALAELTARRPGVEVTIFGDVDPPAAPFSYRFAGVVPPATLARLYGEATVGLVLSLTNYSLIPKEMMACGLPVVDVRGASAESVFGSRPDAIALAEPDPVAIGAALEELLDDPDRRARMSDAGRRLVAGMTWAATAETVERHVRRWLAARWEREAEAASRGARENAAGELAARLS
jgi:glycosyltransferase involved in cell wall biosynthesis